MNMINDNSIQYTGRACIVKTIFCNTVSKLYLGLHHVHHVAQLKHVERQIA